MKEMKGRKEMKGSDNGRSGNWLLSVFFFSPHWGMIRPISTRVSLKQHQSGRIALFAPCAQAKPFPHAILLFFCLIRFSVSVSLASLDLLLSWLFCQ